MERPDVFALFLPEMRQLLKEKQFSALKEFLRKIHSMDLAEGTRHLPAPERIIVFRLLKTRRAIEVFEHLPFDEQSFLLNNLDNAEVAEIINEMAPDERAELFKDLPRKVVKKLFSLMRKEEIDDVRKLLTYKEGTGGALMTTEFVELKKHMTARRAILMLQESQRAGQAGDIYTIYVTDDEHRLIGGVSLQRLITSPPDMRIGDLLTNMELTKINVNLEEEDAGKHFSKYDLLDVPVVDDENHLLGIVTIDDVVDLIQREATEDIYSIGKISGAESAAEIRYDQASVFTLVKERAFWLCILLVIGTVVSGNLLKRYSVLLQSAIILAVFIPMLMDSGGNAGQQANCMIVRALATGEIDRKQIMKVLRKEITVGVLMGITLGIIGMIGAFFLQHEAFTLQLGLTVGFSLAFVVAFATFAGAFMPMLFKSLKLDPAVAASPFITTVVDATCIIVYFEIAKALLF